MEYKLSPSKMSSAASLKDKEKPKKDHDKTMRGRLKKMKDALQLIISGAQDLKKSILEYQDALQAKSEGDAALSARELSEQRLKVEKIDQEVKKAFDLQETENNRLKSQMVELAQDKMEYEQRYIGIEKKVNEQEFILGKTVDMPNNNEKPEIEQE